MTIIFNQGGNFWIETHSILMDSIPPGTNDTQTLTLDRPGFVLSICFSQTSGTIEDIVFLINTIAGGAITLPSGFITQLQIEAENYGAIERRPRINVTVMVRKNGLPA